MNLRKVVDDLISHVREQEDDGLPYESESRKRFYELDKAVWVEACILELEDKLPEKGEETLGETHLPGVYLVGDHFCVLPKGRWDRRLLALVALAERKTKSENVSDSTESDVNWDDYRYGPDGEWLTAEYCKKRFSVIYNNLRADPEAMSTRTKHPVRTRAFVYRYDVVARISNRKGTD